MKIFIIKIILLCLLCVGMDYAYGKLGTYLLDHAISGSSEKNKYICDRTSEDILIMGSSRAVHHYDPTIIEDSLGLSCYNCGYDGCGSITAYGLLSILTERYSPRAILYEITPEFDYLQYDKDNIKYLYPLKMFYDRTCIDSIFMKIDEKEQIKMQSWMYRMNSQLVVLLSGNLMKRNLTIKGFHTKNQVMKYEPTIQEEYIHLEYDSLKMDCLNRIINLCESKGIKLIFYASPAYKNNSSQKYQYAKSLADKNKILFINHYSDTDFVNRKDLFYDAGHMNQDGATAYTRLIIPELRNALKDN